MEPIDDLTDEEIEALADAANAATVAFVNAMLQLVMGEAPVSITDRPTTAVGYDVLMPDGKALVALPQMTVYTFVNDGGVEGEVQA